MTQAQKSPEQIERQIASTRADIDQTISALQDKLSPGQLLDQALGYVKEGGGELAGNFGRTVRENPVPLALMGASLAWLMISSRGGSGASAERERTWRDADAYEATGPRAATSAASPGAGGVSRGSASAGTGASSGGSSAAAATGKIKSKAESAVEGAGAKARRLGEKAESLASDAGERISAARDAASRGLDGARDRAGVYADEARAKAVRARDAAGQFARENPLAVGALALAAGATLAALLPTTRREDELMGEKSDEIKGKAKTVASEQVQKATKAAEVARDAAEEELTRGGSSPKPAGAGSGQTNKAASAPAQGDRTSAGQGSGVPDRSTGQAETSDLSSDSLKRPKTS